jgi:hypothetical protein
MWLIGFRFLQDVLAQGDVPTYSGIPTIQTAIFGSKCIGDRGSLLRVFFLFGGGLRHEPIIIGSKQLTAGGSLPLAPTSRNALGSHPRVALSSLWLDSEFTPVPSLFPRSWGMATIRLSCGARHNTESLPYPCLAVCSTTDRIAQSLNPSPIRRPLRMERSSRLV